MTTPPSGPVMGWNSWYAFRTAISESVILNQANLLVSSGLAAAGYNYVNLDDGWADSSRDGNGNLQPDPAKFPSGMASLAGQVHALGLNFGIYTAIGNRTCQNLPGSWGHYCRDVQTFASWGVDFVKVDECGGLPGYTNQTTLTEDFRQFGLCLREYLPGAVYSQELPVYELGQSGFVQSVQDSSAFANMWRVAGDEGPLTQANAYPMVLGHLNADLHLHAFAGPGHWNDLDMVAPDYPASGWTIQDLENQLAVWALEASPLLIGADLGTLPANALAALTNPGMIAVDQSGAQCASAVTVGNIEALVKPHPAGGSAVCFVNLNSGGNASAQFSLAQLGISTAQATGTDIWTGRTTTFSAAVINLGPGTTRFMQVQPV